MSIHIHHRKCFAQLGNTFPIQLSDICHVGQDHSVDVTISVEAGQESITIEGCDRDVVMTQVVVEQYLWTIDLEHLNGMIKAMIEVWFSGEWRPYTAMLNSEARPFH